MIDQMSVLTVRGLGKSFGGVKAVSDVNFDVRRGELLALIGPNGAGKSTVFNLLNGQLTPDSGSISFNGHDIAGEQARDIWRLGIGRTFQIAETFTSLTVAENVQMALLSANRLVADFGQLVGDYQSDQVTGLLRQVGIESLAHRACADLAYSDVKRLELAMALAHQPELLLMDEPTAGMAPAERLQLMALVKALVAERQMAVLFTEHSMDVVFTYADRVIVLAGGQLIADGTPAQIQDDRAVAEIYFGRAASFKPQVPQSQVPAENHTDKRAPDYLLTVKGLNAWYGQAQALFNVDLAVRPGEVVALMGRNGAGKSTTIKTIMGLITKREGSVLFQGEDISSLTTHHIAARGMGFVPEDRRIFSDLTVLENLETGRRPLPQRVGHTSAKAWTIEALFTLFPNLAAMPDRLGRHMSGGEQQMLTLARTLMGNPCLVLMDEPSEGIAPLIVEQMVHAILQLKQQGVSILLSEQNMHFVSLVADRVYTLDQGTVTFTGSLDDFLHG